jgi:hypothetical protein
MSKFEKLLVLDPIYFECVRQGDSKRLGDLLGLTKGLQYGINPDESFRIGLHNRPAVNLAIEAGHIEVGKFRSPENLIFNRVQYIIRSHVYQ